MVEHVNTRAVEIAGRNWLVARLLIRGIEVATPDIDRGIDLIAFREFSAEDGGLGPDDPGDPGYERTDMGGPNATIGPEESARGGGVIEREAGSGGHRFLDWKGEAAPW